MNRLRLLLRGMWWRRGLTFALLVVGTVTTAAAALGPLYARAASESILQDHLQQAGAGANLWFRSEGPVSPRNYYNVSRPDLPKPGSIPGYDQLIPAIQTANDKYTAAPVSAPDQSAKTTVVWRPGQCAHLVILRGRCPSAADQVLVSQQLAGTSGSAWSVGSQVRLSPFNPADSSVSLHAPKPATVVGVYRPKDALDPYWYGQDFFGSHPALFVTSSEFFDSPMGGAAETDYTYPLTTNKIRLANAHAEALRIDKLKEQTLIGSSAILTTRLPEIIASARTSNEQSNADTLLITLQLTILAWLVLLQVVSDAIEARGNEVAMAKLRGHGVAATLRFGLGEPLAILAVTVPLGVLVAWGATHLFGSTALVAGVPVDLTWSAVYAALLAFAGGVLAAIVAAFRVMTRSVLDQWRRSDRQPARGRLGLVIDVVLAALAVAALVRVLTRPSPLVTGDPLALLAPALLVFAVALIGIRLLPVLCRMVARRTRGTRHLATFLAVSQVARRPVGLRLAALLAIAVGLATFGVAGESVADTNREHRAAAEIGADQVAQVDFGPRTDPIQATHTADPQGRWAMTAATWLPAGGGSVVGTVLAVDPSRLTSVAAPVAGGLSNATLAGIVGGASVEPITVTTSTMRVTLTATDLQGNKRPDVQLNLRTSSNPAVNAEGPAVRPGTHTYDVAVPCTHSCSLRGITWDRPIDATTTLRGTIVLQALDYRSGTSWRAADIGLGHRGAWYALPPAGEASDHVTVGNQGITDRFENTDGGYGGIAFGADPAIMPAVSTEYALTTDVSAPSVPEIQDAAPNTARFRVVRTTTALPAVLNRGVLLNVRYLVDELPLFSEDAHWEVWVGPHAPSDWRQRLGRAGLHVEQVSTIGQRVKLLGRQAPALALLLLLVCSLVGAVLAVGGTAVSVSASSRRRSYELAAMQTLGVRRSVLYRANLIEQLLLLGAAVVIGVPVGWVAARVTIPIIPEFDHATPVSLQTSPSWVPTVAFAAAFVALLVLVAAGSARALIRVAVPSRLREAE